MKAARATQWAAPRQLAMDGAHDEERPMSNVGIITPRFVMSGIDHRTPRVAEAREVLRALVGVHADQLRRIAADTHPARFGLLAAVESAGGLGAAEMSARGMPWRADVHDALLARIVLIRPTSASGWNGLEM